MMSSNNGKKFTVQGADPPVPVGVSGDGTGHSRPSASDSPGPPVVRQAGETNRATGSSGESIVGPREDKGRRSTEKRASNVATFDLRHEEKAPERTLKTSRLTQLSQLRRCSSVDTGKKRKVMDTSTDDERVDTVRKTEDSIAFVIREAIETVIKLSKDLDKRIVENPNTKREIKDIATKLKRNAEVLGRDTSTAWWEKHRWTHAPIPVYDVECQTVDELNTRTAPDTVAVACQTDEVAGTWRPTRREERKVDISDMELNSFEEKSPVLEKPWERHCYVVTKITRGNMATPKEGNVVYFANTNPEVATKKVTRMRNLHPELMHSEVITCEGGTYVGVEQITRYSAAGAGLKTRVKHIVEMRMDDGKMETELLRDMYGMLKESCQIMSHVEDEGVAILVPPGVSADKLRKIAEIVYRRAGRAVNLMVAKERKDPAPKKDREKGAALVVACTAETYAETLKDVKAKITDESVIGAIQSIRRTIRGNLLMTFKAGSTKACKEAGAALGTIKSRIAGSARDKTLIS